MVFATGIVVRTDTRTPTIAGVAFIVAKGNDMIDLYCDGSCPRPYGPGGWAFIVRGNGNEHQASGSERDTTNNRMEMVAAIKGFEWLEKQRYGGERVMLTSDSQYVIRGLNQWAASWKLKGWRRRNEDGKWIKIKNADLWPVLYHLAHETFRTEFSWVRGHDGHEYNELCDKLAGEAAWALIERGA
jgi:ribonuclease HI